MFKELQPLLAGRSFVLIITQPKPDQINVNLTPKATSKDKHEDKALLTPLSITGTAEELDTQLAEAITSYADSYKTVAEQVAATKAAMKATADAAEEKRKAGAAEAKNKGKGKTPAAPAKKVEPAKPAEKKTDAAPSLFDAPAETVTEDATEDEEETEEVFEP